MMNTKLQMNKLLTHKYSLCIFFLLSLIPFYWLQGHPIGYGDTGLMAFFYNSEYLSGVYRYTWLSQYLTGYFAAQRISLLPLSGFFSLLTFFGLNTYIQQALTYFIVLFVSMTFFYLFVYGLFDYKTEKKLIATLSAIFYAFNSLVMINYWYFGVLSIYLLPFIPITLHLFSIGLKRQKFVYSILMSLIISFFSIVFFNPAFVIPMIMILALFFIWKVILSWKNKAIVKKLFIYSIGLTILAFLMNLWFILPSLSAANTFYSYATAAENPLQTLKSVSYSTDFQALFRLLPLTLSSGIWAYNDPPWRWAYNNPFFVFLGFLITIVALLSPFKRDRHILFFTLMFIVGLFLCLGLNSPFGFIFEWMFKNIPFFDMFRSPYNKFMPFLLVSYTVLFGYGVTTLYGAIKNKLSVKMAKLVVIVMMILMCVIYVFPMWTGNVVNTPITIRGNEISSFVEVPSYYQNIAEYFQKDPTDYRILSLPLRPSTYVGFDWQYGYDGPDYTWLLYKHDTISYLDNNYDPSAQIISGLTERNLTNALYEMAALFSVKYVVIQHDVDIVHGNYGGKPLTNQQELSLILSQSNLTFIDSFGKLDLYKVDDQYVSPLIYSSLTSTLIIGNVSEMSKLIASDDFKLEKPALILSEQLNPAQSPIISEQTTRSLLYKEAEDVFTELEGFSIIPEPRLNNVSVVAFSQPNWVDDSFKEGWHLFDAQAATPIWSTDGDIVSLGINSSDAGHHLVAMKKTNMKVNIQESPYITINAKTTNATMYIGFRIENSTGYVWDLMGSGWSPLHGLDVQNSGWVTKTANIYEWAKSIGISDEKGELYVTGISYYTYNNGVRGTSDTYMDYIAFSKVGASSPKPAKAAAEIYIPQSGNYSVALRVATGQDYGRLIMTIRGKQSVISSNSINAEPILAYRYISPIYLDKGNYEVSITSNETVEIDSIFIYSFKAGEQNQKIDDLFASEDNKVNLTYTKIDPTKYVVHVNASNPFSLVFSESYHKDWIAYINGQQIPNEYHFLVNGYANGWCINKTGTYTITLEFWPQNLFYVGSAISIVTLILCTLYVSKDKIKTIYRKHIKHKQVSKVN